MKTLYISDLDGTLLDSRSEVSRFCKETINSLIGCGMNFSFASARSPYSAAKATSGLDISFGVVYNGAFIVDMKSGKRLTFNAFEAVKARAVFEAYLSHGIYPAVFSYIDGLEKCTYHKKLSSPLMIAQRKKDKDDPRLRAVDDAARMLDGEVFYFSAMGSESELRPIYDKLKGDFECFYYLDHEKNMSWLEVLPKGVSKASSVRALAEMLSCERIVAFGDGKNDIPLFEVSDECYAVENATTEIKEIATEVIASNDNDGVARWLGENYKKKGHS